MRNEMIQNNYMYIPKFIGINEAADLSLDFKNYCKKFTLVGDQQVPESQSMYNFLPFVRLLVEKVPEVTALLGAKVLPTYTYARVYRNGAVLDRHRDRPACEVSLTVNLSKSHDWPIYFQRPNGSETFVELEPGDAVMYMGCVADHWREQFVGDEYTQVFMHYVRSYGTKSWAYFDKQQQQTPTPQTDGLPVTIL